MCKKRLDMKEKMPWGMEEYLGLYGWHFNKKLCEWAVSRMRRKEGEKLQMLRKEDLDTLFRRYGLDPTEFNGYDAVYVYHMAKADYGDSSIRDDQHLVLFVKDYLTDPDGYDEVAMTRFYADCIGKGEMPDWEECI